MAATLLVATPALALARPATVIPPMSSPLPADRAGSGPPSTPSGAASPSADAASLAVAVGKSLVVKTSANITKVAITDPTIADVAVLSRHEILLNGKRPGVTSCIVWTRKGRQTYDVLSEVDVGLLRQTI
ncbi:MAG: pilus assembly protein N-terminal domain-containing protein, partial [Cyanobacteria bacterium REEB65]|nr:pilus assembly protein N-terminal domain-containing protein [Cyanobacteria bacterium REEB65]